MTTKTKDRSFGLSADELKKFQDQYVTDKKLPNPHHQGCYHFIIAALTNLGIDQPHELKIVYERFQKEAGREWFSIWANREGRNEKTAKDAEGRFLQNLKVLQRTKDFGRKLLEVGRKMLKSKGCVIDLSRGEDGSLMVTLNTDSSKPMKAGRAKGAPKADAVAGATGTVLDAVETPKSKRKAKAKRASTSKAKRKGARG